MCVLLSLLCSFFVLLFPYNFAGSTGDNRGPGNSSRSSQSTAEHKSPESVVRMVIVSGSDRKPARCPSCDADKVLPGHILMPPGVSQQLDVQYPSLVRLKGVSHPPSGIKGLILHPVEGCTDKVGSIRRDRGPSPQVRGLKKELASVHKVEGSRNFEI